MADARTLIAAVHDALRPVEARILQHPFLEACAAGRVPRERLCLLAGEQYHIITSDLRSVAHLVSRCGEPPARGFFLDTLAGEQRALELLPAFAQAVGLAEADLPAYEPLPGAHAYTCYMAWLALYGSAAEVATAYLVNFPAWGQNCARLSHLLQERYGLAPAAVAFFDHFAASPAGFEAAALAVIQDGLDRGADPRRLHRAARLLQGYELLYWDTLHAAGDGAPA